MQLVLEILFPGGQRPEYETNHSRTSSAVVPKVCSADSKISATSSQGIRGHNSVIVTFKLDVLLKDNRGNSLIGHRVISYEH